VNLKKLADWGKDKLINEKIPNDLRIPFEDESHSYVEDQAEHEATDDEHELNSDRDEAETAAFDVFELIPPVPGLVEQFKPRQKYLLIDENAYTESELASVKNLVAAVFRIEHPVKPEAVRQLIGLLSE